MADRLPEERVREIAGESSLMTTDEIREGASFFEAHGLTVRPATLTIHHQEGEADATA